MASNLKPNQLFDPVLDLRMVNSVVFVNLIRILAEQGPVNYTRLLGLVIQSGLVTKSGTPLGKSSFYHHLKMALALALVYQAGRGKSYSLTEKGLILSDVLKKQGRTQENFDCPLSAGETTALRQIVIDSIVLQKAFFWLFTGLANNVPLSEGRKITITPCKIKQQDKTDKRSYCHEIRSSFHPTSIILGTIESQAIVMGLRTWCLELGVLGEMVTTARDSIQENAVQILFPVRWPSLTESSDFEEKLLFYFWQLAEHRANYWQVSIPELLYRLCPGEHVTLEDAKAWLSKWLKTNRAFIFSNVFSPAVAMRNWVRKPQDYQRLLKGYLYSDEGYISHIGILDEAIKKGRFVKDR